MPRLKQSATSAKNQELACLAAYHLAQKGMTQKELAARVGVHEVTISKYLKDPTPILGTARRIFFELGFSAEEIGRVM